VSIARGQSREFLQVYDGAKRASHAHTAIFGCVQLVNLGSSLYDTRKRVR
jgi:hypothetical protein